MRTQRPRPFDKLGVTTSGLFTFPLRHSAGFTLTELTVLVAVGAILSGLLMADLSQTRTTLLRQACAANLEHWGMAIYLYSQDYNGLYLYTVVHGGAANGPYFDDVGSPYYRYFGGSDPTSTIRTMRICPAVAARMTQDQINASSIHTYSMPVAMVRGPGGGYVAAPVDLFKNFWGFNLRTVPYPSQYLLLIDSKGNTLTCGHLKDAVTQINTSSGDSIPAIDRHGGGVNCLFGDLHVEWVSSQTISNQDTVSCSGGNPWFMMN